MNERKRPKAWLRPISGALGRFRFAAGVRFGPQLEERLCAYARSVAHFPTAVKELQWRNGWFYGLSQAAAAAGKADPFPQHTAWLKEVKAVP